MMRPAIAGGLAGVIIGLLWPIALHAAELDGWARPAHVLSIFAPIAPSGRMPPFVAIGPMTVQKNEWFA